MTVGFVVRGQGFYGLTRRPAGATDDEDELDLLVHQVVDGAAWLTDETFRPPIWPESSRMPPELARVHDRVIRCRYGHELRVPSVAAIDRMLKKSDGGVVFLPAARRV